MLIMCDLCEKEVEDNTTHEFQRTDICTPCFESIENRTNPEFTDMYREEDEEYEREMEGLLLSNEGD